MPDHDSPSNRSGGVLLYFGLTFAWTWLFWLPMLPAFHRHGLEAPPWALGLLFVGAYGPSLVAVGLAAHARGGAGVRALLAKFTIWRVGLRWYLVAFFLPAIVSLGGALLYAARGGDIGGLDFSRVHLIPVALLVGSVFGPLAEELGWRGYALPRLLERHGPLASSLILGAAWTFWHAPLYWAPAGTSISGQPVTLSAVAFYLAFLTGYSVFYTWIHLHTRGSVLLAFLLHLTFNAELLNRVMPALWDVSGTIERYSLVPLWLLAGWVIWRRFRPGGDHRRHPAKRRRRRERSPDHPPMGSSARMNSQRAAPATANSEPVAIAAGQPTRPAVAGTRRPPTIPARLPPVFRTPVPTGAWRPDTAMVATQNGASVS